MTSRAGSPIFLPEGTPLTRKFHKHDTLGALQALGYTAQTAALCVQLAHGNPQRASEYAYHSLHTLAAVPSCPQCPECSRMRLADMELGIYTSPSPSPSSSPTSSPHVKAKTLNEDSPRGSESDPSTPHGRCRGRSPGSPDYLNKELPKIPVPEASASLSSSAMSVLASSTAPRMLPPTPPLPTLPSPPSRSLTHVHHRPYQAPARATTVRPPAHMTPRGQPKLPAAYVPATGRKMEAQCARLDPRWSRI